MRYFTDSPFEKMMMEKPKQYPVSTSKDKPPKKKAEVDNCQKSYRSQKKK